MNRLLAGGRSITIITYPDFSFRDEWSGIYSLDEKVLDYIAVKTEWGWAAPGNAVVEKTTATPQRITLHHEINGHEVVVTISVRTAKFMGAELEQLVVRVDGSRKNVIEMGVCGRHAYTVRVVHVPFRERAAIGIKHIPPRFVKAVQTSNTSFSTDSAEWDELYRRAKETIKILTKRRGWYAGLPWFVQYWGRDTFLSVPALIREGYVALTKRTLRDFVSKIVDGEVPRLIRENGAPEFGSIDTNPLLLNAVADYVTITGDYQFLAENSTAIQEAFMWILDTAEGYFPRSRGKDTWMDTLEIRKHPVEVAAYVLSAARKLAILSQIPGDAYKEAQKQWENEQRKYLQDFTWRWTPETGG